jgi:hypothetical protein
MTVLSSQKIVFWPNHLSILDGIFLKERIKLLFWGLKNFSPDGHAVVKFGLFWEKYDTQLSEHL